MNESLTEFLTTFPVNNPLLWALLVMVVVAGTSLALFLFWEVLLRLRLPFVSSQFGSSQIGTPKDNNQSGGC